MSQNYAEQSSAHSLAIGQNKPRSAPSQWGLLLTNWKLIAQRAWRSISQDDLTGRSAQLAYYFFFSLFPGLVALSAVFGLVVASGHAFSDRLIAYLGTVIPPSAFSIVSSTLEQTTKASSGGKVVVGLLAALWSASAGTSAIQDALNSVHKVKEQRPFWKTRVQAIALTIAIVICFTAALSVMLAGDVAADRLSGPGATPPAFTIAFRILSWPIAFAVVAVVFALVYYVAPDVRQARWKWLTPGALIGILLWLAASTGLRVYLRFFNSYSVTYGSLGAVIVLLTWFYISGLALLIGAEINMAVKDLATQQGDPDAKAQGEKSRLSEAATARQPDAP
jgi:membrane protein